MNMEELRYGLNVLDRMLKYAIKDGERRDLCAMLSTVQDARNRICQLYGDLALHGFVPDKEEGGAQ